MAEQLAGGTFLYFRPWYRKSPYFEATRRAGCTSYELYNHMYLPGYYTSFEEEYWHLLEHVALWDVAVERCVEITGPDAHRFTNMLTCRDLDRCAVGQAKYAPIMTADGGIVNDPVLLRLGENHYWLALADSDGVLYAKGVAACAGMDVEVGEAESYPVQVQGPKSRDVMRALFGEMIDGIRYYWTAQADLDGIPVVISRTGWTAELGFEIYLRDAGRGEDLWNRILEAGAPFNIKPTGPSDIRRMEAGIFNWGPDFNWHHNPFEVTGMERLVEEQEADYLGKEALELVRREGVRRKLVGVEIGGEEQMPDEMEEFWPVHRDAKEVGYVTNAVWSPRLKRNIGYMWVPIELAAVGTTVDVMWSFGAPVEGRVAELPFIDPKKDIPKG